MRHLIIFFIGALALIGSIVGTYGTIYIRDYELRGYVNPTNNKNLPYSVPRLGVNVQLEQYTVDALHENLQLIRDSNFKWVRQFAYWDQIEPEKGKFNWTSWDRIVDTISEYPELELVIVFMNTPQWARVNPPNKDVIASAPPETPETLANFVAMFAERYGTIIDYYQIWDEPNLDDAWGLLNPQPANYVALLTDAYIAIHDNDPSATVISAALAPTTDNSGQNISDIHYLEKMYALGAKNSMDVVASKPYGFSSSPLDRDVDDAKLNFSRVIALREIMLANNDGEKSLWASNWGWNSLPETWDGNPSLWGNVTDQEQIQFTLQALDRVHRELPWLGGMILHQWQPQAEALDPQWGFALLDAQNEPSPLLQAIQNYELPTLPQNGLFHPLTPFARYSGVWEFSSLGADIGWLETTDSQLYFDFKATEISILAREDDYVAFLYPTIEGETINLLPHDNQNNPYIFLRSNTLEPEKSLIKIANNLKYEEHTLKVIADKGWDQWAIAGYAVSSGDLSIVYNNQITIGYLAIIVSALVTVLNAIQVPWRKLSQSLASGLATLNSLTHIFIAFITSIVLMLTMLITWTTQKPNIFLIRDDVNLLLAIVTGGILYLSPHIFISIIAVIILFTLFFYRLETGLILLILWMPFFLFPVELYVYAFPTSEIILMILFLAWLTRQIHSLSIELQMSNSQYAIIDLHNISKRVHILDILVYTLGCLSIISLLWTRYHDVAFTELRQFIIEPIIFYTILRSCNPDRKLIIQLVDALICSAVIVSLIGLIQYSQGEAIITAEAGAKRLASVYGSPNNVGLLLGRAMPFVFAYFVLVKTTTRRLFSIITLFIMTITLALTQSIGAILLGIPASLVVMLLVIYGKRSYIPISISLISSVLGFTVLTQISARFANILDFTSGTNFFRLRVWESAIEIIQNHPITGIGLDQFLYIFRGEFIRPDAIWDRDLSHPHNFILDFWTRLGIFGLLTFCIIQIIFWKMCVALVKVKPDDKLLYAITVGVMGSMADLIAHGMIDNSVFVYDLAFIFMLQLTIPIMLNQIRQKETVTN